MPAETADGRLLQSSDPGARALVRQRAASALANNWELETPPTEAGFTQDDLNFVRTAVARIQASYLSEKSEGLTRNVAVGLFINEQWQNATGIELAQVRKDSSISDEQRQAKVEELRSRLDRYKESHAEILRKNELSRLPVPAHPQAADEIFDDSRERGVDTSTNHGRQTAKEDSLDESLVEQELLTLEEVEDVWRIISINISGNDGNGVENAAYLLNMLPDDYYLALLDPTEVGGKEQIVSPQVRTHEQTIETMREDLPEQDFRRLQLNPLMDLANSATPDDFITILQLAEPVLHVPIFNRIYRTVAGAARNIWTAQLGKDGQLLKVATDQYQRLSLLANALREQMARNDQRYRPFPGLESAKADGEAFINSLSMHDQDFSSSAKPIVRVVSEGVRRGMYADIKFATDMLERLLQEPPRDIPARVQPMVDAVAEAMAEGSYPRVQKAIKDIQQIENEVWENEEISSAAQPMINAVIDAVRRGMYSDIEDALSDIHIFEGADPFNEKEIVLFDLILRNGIYPETLGLTQDALSAYYSLTEGKTQIPTVHEVAVSFEERAERIVGERIAHELLGYMRSRALSIEDFSAGQSLENFIESMIRSFPAEGRVHPHNERTLNSTQRIQLRGLLHAYARQFAPYADTFVGGIRGEDNISLRMSRVLTVDALRNSVLEIATTNEGTGFREDMEMLFDAVDLFWGNLHPMRRNVFAMKGNVSALTAQFREIIGILLAKREAISMRTISDLTDKEARSRFLKRFTRGNEILQSLNKLPTATIERLSELLGTRDYDYLIEASLLGEGFVLRNQEDERARAERFRQWQRLQRAAASDVGLNVPGSSGRHRLPSPRNASTSLRSALQVENSSGEDDAWLREG